LPLSLADITLGKHERRHLPAFRPAHHRGKAATTRWKPYSDRRESTFKTATHHSQQVPPESTESNHPGSHRPGISIAITEPSTPGQNSNHHQASHPAVIPQCNEETQSTIRLSPHCPKDSLWSVDLFRCELIGPASRLLKTHWVMVVMDQYTRRIIGFAIHAGNMDGITLCRMFNVATRGDGWPLRISSDNDPLFQYHRWKANLRVLDIEEIKSLPYVPMSHPFVERLIGSVRRELLDQTLFWTKSDLENKLQNYQRYYNEYRCHSSRDGATPVESESSNVIDIRSYRWRKHCRGLFQLPVAA